MGGGFGGGGFSGGGHVGGGGGRAGPVGGGGGFRGGGFHAAAPALGGAPRSFGMGARGGGVGFGIPRYSSFRARPSYRQPVYNGRVGRSVTPSIVARTAAGRPQNRFSSTRNPVGQRPAAAANCEREYNNAPDNGAPVADTTVQAVQTELTQLGYYNGPVDGIFGPTTRDAVAKYQMDKQLEVTGSLSPDTLQSLGVPPGANY